MKAKTVLRRASDSEAMMPKTETESFFVHKRRRVPGETLADQIACSKIHTRNYKWKEANFDFPREAWMRKVDKFYPFAFQGKGLFIDEPQRDDDVIRCERKKQVLQSHGYRYVIIKKDTTLEELLEEAQSWHGPRS